MKFINAISFQNKLIRLLVVFISTLALAACGGGGGSAGTPPSNQGSGGGSINALALFTTAGGPVVVDVGATRSDDIGGGTMPYKVSSNNTGVATAGLLTSTSFFITGVTAGTAIVNIVDAVGQSVSVSVSVGGSGSATTAVFVMASSSVVIAASGTTSYRVGGGSGAYVASSSNKGVVTADVNVGNLILTPTAGATGTAEVVVFDLLGNSIKMNVTVGSGAASSLYMTAPSAMTVAPNAKPTFQVGGGTGPYRVSSSNEAVATASPDPLVTTSTGTTLTITAGNAFGTALISVFDAKGASVTTQVTVSSSATTGTSLFVAAPSAVTIPSGTTSAPYAVGGGAGSYTWSSSNEAVASASLGASGLRIVGGIDGTAKIMVFDAAGASVAISVTVSTGSDIAPLYMTAPSSMTLPSGGTAKTFKVGGGTAPYQQPSSSNEAVAKVGLSGTTLTITGFAAGTAQITVFDAIGKSVSTSVSVGAAAGASLFTTAPGSFTLAVGETTAPSYAISGGTAPYLVTTSNFGVARADLLSSGTDLTVTGKALGNAQITITDAVGATVKLSVTVGSSGLPLATTAPSSITLGVGETPSYTINGGTGSYTVTSNDTGIATTSGSSGATLNVKGIAVGSAIIVVRDAANVAVSITVNVVASRTLLTTAPSAVTLAVGGAESYTIVSGTATYSVVSSNTLVAAASLTGAPNNTLNVVGKTPGLAQIVVYDASGDSVTVAVTVSASGAVLFTTAPASVTLGVSTTIPPTATTYTVGGGTPGYVADSSNTSVATASVVGSTLRITGKVEGIATVSVADAAGITVSIKVTVGSGSALFSTAPSAVAIAISTPQAYSIGGGSAPYVVTSSSTSIAEVTMPTPTATTFTITGKAAGTAKVIVVDQLGASVSIDVTVSLGGASPLFTTVPGPLGCTVLYDGCVSIAALVSPTYVVGGGTAPYAATSSDVTKVTANLTGTALTITGIAAGSANVQVSDALGAVVFIKVTVTAPVATPAPLAVNPSTSTARVGDVLSFAISGGSPAYTVAVSSPAVASVSTSSVAVSGGTFNASLRSAGTTGITITDLAGHTSTVNLTVDPASGALRMYPSLLQVGEDYAARMTLGIVGGTGVYTGSFTSDSVLSSVLVVGSTLVVDLGSQGTRCISVGVPVAQTYKITLTVTDSAAASTTSDLVIVDNGKGDGSNKCGAP